MSEPKIVTAPSPRSQALSALITGVAGGLLTLVDPAKLRPVSRTGIYLISGAAPAALTWFATVPDKDQPSTTGRRAALSVGLGLLGAGGTKVGFVIDSQIHRALIRRGLKNPRPVMAIGAAVLVATMSLLEPAPRETVLSSTEEEEDAATALSQDRSSPTLG